ncbi:hypothetical protein U1Q18_009359 [Sarracenia purpurea var. burkii]
MESNEAKEKCSKGSSGCQAFSANAKETKGVGAADTAVNGQFGSGEEDVHGIEIRKPKLILQSTGEMRGSILSLQDIGVTDPFPKLAKQEQGSLIKGVLEVGNAEIEETEASVENEVFLEAPVVVGDCRKTETELYGNKAPILANMKIPTEPMEGNLRSAHQVFNETTHPVLTANTESVRGKNGTNVVVPVCQTEVGKESGKR